MKKIGYFWLLVPIILFVGMVGVFGGVIKIQSTPIVQSAAAQPTPDQFPDIFPRLQPPGNNGYTSQQLNTKITAPDGRLIGQLTNPPSDISPSISVSFPAKIEPDDGVTHSVAILGSVIYVENGHKIIVTTSKPSAASKASGYMLGDQKIQLSNGVTAWTKNNRAYSEPNQVVFEQNNLIIMVASDLPLSTIETLALTITIK